MKTGIFTDSHYSSAELTCGKRFNSKSLAKIKEALEYFRAEECDLVICLGDLIDSENEHENEIKHLEEIATAFENSGMKIFAVMGNHDGFAFDVDEFYGILGEECRPRNLYFDNENLIFIDACYFKNGKHYKRGDSDWTDTFFPHTDKLAKALENVRGNTYIFMHQNIDPSISEDHRLSNDAEVREILEKSGKVKTVFQGHFHPGFQSEHNGISYVAYPAVCENEKAYFIVEL